MIWENAYREASRDPEFDTKLRAAIDRIFQEFSEENVEKNTAERKPVCWQLLGLIVRMRSLDICLAPKDEASYQSIVELRRAIFQNGELISLGIEQQYHLTAHLTLGYFGKIPDDRTRSNALLSEFGDRWLGERSPEMTISHAQLYKFEDMTRYYREPSWPSFEF